MIHKLFLIEMMYAEMAIRAQGAPGNAVAYQKWTAACALKAEFTKTQTRAAAQLTRPAAASEAYLQQYMKTKIYLEKVKNGVYTAEHQVLLSYYAEKASKNSNKLQSLEIKQTLTQIRDTARPEASIAGFVTALAHITASATHSRIETETGGGTARSASAAQDIKQTGCEMESSEVQDTNRAAAGLSEAGFDNAAFIAEADVTVASGSTECSLTAAKAANRLLDADGGLSNVAGEQNYAGGLFFLHDSGLKVRATNKRNTLPPEAAVLKAALIAADAAKGSTEQFIFKKPSQLKTDPDFNRLWRNIVLKQIPAKTDDDKAVETATGEAFGGDTTMEATYNTNLKTTMVVNFKGDTPREVELQTLVNFDDLERVLTHYQALNADTLKSKIKEFQDTLNKQDSKAAADTCNKITNKNECNNKAFCSYNATEQDTTKKCQFNETKVPKSRVHVAQTQTG
uniref:Variant surface glycoprotein 1125.4799 n=1 Tax=Trypanosoma brucei TaxID=5691 RepID=A0A1J0RBA5_9TRYP|nr:variant surface glycoprotein 1125.4799 [Trypanosoma brucei]